MVGRKLLPMPGPISWFEFAPPPHPNFNQLVLGYLFWARDDEMNTELEFYNSENLAVKGYKQLFVQRIDWAPTKEEVKIYNGAVMIRD